MYKYRDVEVVIGLESLYHVVAVVQPFRKGLPKLRLFYGLREDAQNSQSHLPVVFQKQFYRSNLNC